MSSPDKQHLFISYARRGGRDLALRLRDDLKKHAHRVWLDTTNIEGGAQWSREIEQGIDNCDVLLALLSQGSYDSAICRGEQLRALRKGKRLIPLLVEPKADRPVYIEGDNYRDFSTLSNYEQSLRQLLDDIDGVFTAEIHDGYRKTYVTTDPLPANFVKQPDKLDALRSAVIRDSRNDETNKPVAVTALRGLGGIGKTVLAQALCKDHAIQPPSPMASSGQPSAARPATSSRK